MRSSSCFRGLGQIPGLGSRHLKRLLRIPGGGIPDTPGGQARCSAYPGGSGQGALGALRGQVGDPGALAGVFLAPWK